MLQTDDEKDDKAGDKKDGGRTFTHSALQILFRKYDID
jgi:hypothetical protein